MFDMVPLCWQRMRFADVYPVDVEEALGLWNVLQWLSDILFDNVDSRTTYDTFHF